MFHAVHLHAEGTGQIIGCDLLTVDIAVRDEDFRVIIVNGGDNSGNGVVQFRGDNMTALAGNDLQLSVLTGPGQNRLLDAQQFNGFP